MCRPGCSTACCSQQHVPDGPIRKGGGGGAECPSHEDEGQQWDAGQEGQCAAALRLPTVGAAGVHQYHTQVTVCCNYSTARY